MPSTALSVWGSGAAAAEQWQVPVAVVAVTVFKKRSERLQIIPAERARHGAVSSLLLHIAALI